MGKIGPRTNNVNFVKHLELELDRLGWICSEDLVKAFWAREKAVEAGSKSEDKSRNQEMLLNFDEDWEKDEAGFMVVRQ